MFLGLARHKHEQEYFLNEYYKLKKTEDRKMANAMAKYVIYKKNYVRNIMFNPSTISLGM